MQTALRTLSLEGHNVVLRSTASCAIAWQSVTRKSQRGSANIVENGGHGPTVTSGGARPMNDTENRHYAERVRGVKVWIVAGGGCDPLGVMGPMPYISRTHAKSQKVFSEKKLRKNYSPQN